MTFAFENRSRTARADTASPVPFRPATSGNQTSLRRLAVQRKCSACEDEDKGGAMQRKAADSSAPEAAPDAVHSVLGGSGRPLDPESRAFMEPRFGQDFGGVRVHTGADADTAARSINARAFTSGNNVVFGAGEYSPATDAGRRLLSHELTHVVQQGSGLALKSGVGPSNDSHERQADQVADTIAAGGSAKGLLGGSARAATGASGAVQREEAKKPTCPATHTTPDDIYKGIDDAWKKSGHGGATVTEHGGSVIEDTAGKRVIRTTSGGGGSITRPQPGPGETMLAGYHTHPYSTSEGSHLGVGFSGGDISVLIGGGAGKTSYVGAGSCNFALDTISQTDRDACKTVDIAKRWNDEFAKATGTMQEKVDKAVLVAIAGCGLCYYKACQPDAKSAVPKVLNLK